MQGAESRQRGRVSQRSKAPDGHVGRDPDSVICLWINECLCCTNLRLKLRLETKKNEKKSKIKNCTQSDPAFLANKGKRGKFLLVSFSDVEEKGSSQPKIYIKKERNIKVRTDLKGHFMSPENKSKQKNCIATFILRLSASVGLPLLAPPSAGWQWSENVMFK